jgi:broad specificity phosphatase PhoE
MAKRLLLVRHGRLGANHVGRLIGATDLPLDPIGQRQGQALARRLARWSPETCFCSPMQRCRQMAALVAPELPPQLDLDLREIDFGRWEMLTLAEAAADNPSLLDRWAEMNLDCRFPGGETVGGFLDRVRAAAEQLIHAQAETVLAVTHGGVIRMMLCHLLGLAPQQHMVFDVPYAVTVVIDLFDGKGVLVALERPEEVAHG